MGITSGDEPNDPTVIRLPPTKQALDIATANINVVVPFQGSGSPSTAPRGNKPTSTIYYRKAELSSGVGLKSTFADVGFGNQDSVTVTGGSRKTIFYSTYILPPKANFGESQLTNLYSVLPVTSVTRKDFTTQPRLKIWKGNNNTYTEGSTTFLPNTVLAFMSHIDMEEDIVENFDGGNKDYRVSRIGNSTVFEQDAYIPAEWAWNNMDSTAKWHFDKDEFIDEHCETQPNNTGLGTERICKVQERTQYISGTIAGIIHLLSPGGYDEGFGKEQYTQYIATKNSGAKSLDPTWSYEKLQDAGYPLYSYKTVVNEDVTSSSDININNSLFEVFNNNNPWKDSEGKDLFVASAEYSKEKVFSGAYSAKLRTLYSNTTLKTSGEFPDLLDSGATNRQEVMMQYGPMPMPTALDFEDSGTNKTAYRISWDMNIDQLAPAWNDGTSGIDNDRMVRAICVTLSDVKYTKEDGTLYDWIKAKQAGTDEFAYFFVWKTTQNSANAADADHSIVCMGNDDSTTLGTDFWDDDSSNKMIRVKSGVDPFSTAGKGHTKPGGIPAGEWLHWDITTMPSFVGYRVRCNRLSAANEEELLASFQMKGVTDDYMDSLDVWTPYIQFWLVNYPADTTENIYSTLEDTESAVFIDNFRISNSNYRIENATICDENTTREQLTFESNKARKNNNETFDAPRILSLGVFDEAMFPDGEVKNFFFNNFGSANHNDTSPLAVASTDVAWSAFSSGGSNRLDLGWPMATAANGVHTKNSTMAFTDGSGTNVGLTVNGTIGSLSHNAGTGTEVAWTGSAGNEGFSQPGILQIDYDDDDYSGFTKIKRENHFVKARVTKIIEVSTNKCVVEVDKPNIFKIPSTSTTATEPFQFRLYLHNESFGVDNTPSNGLRDMTLESINGNKITLLGNATVDDDGNALLTTANMPAICISPLAFWICMYYKWTDGTDALPKRTYSSVCLVNNGVAAGITSGNFGATWNEHKFSDTSTYDNSWSWSKTENSSINVKTDYGYGSYDSETGNGGYASVFSPSASEPTGAATTGVNFNMVDISGIISADGIKPDDTLSLAVTPADDMHVHEIAINTDDASAGVRPFLLAGFTDSVAPPPTFTAVPYENDPTKVQFNWATSGKDWWYGFIIVDSEPIFNKYHKVGMHIPNFFTLEKYNGNKDLASGTGSGLKYYNYTANTTNDVELDSTFDIDFEGLCGFTPAFDGDAYIRADADHLEIGDPSAPPTTNMTIMGHLRISALPGSGTDEIVTIEDNSNNVAFELEIGTDGGLTATVAPGSGTAVALTSVTKLIPDNETPYAFCVTLDTEIPNGNVKLFINGRLEDQSGALTSAGSSNNWKSGQSWDDPSNGYVYLGNDDSNDGFHGTIEEFVISHRTFYPVIVEDGVFVLDKNLKELASDSTGTSLSYNARIILCDYHNISGKTTSEITMSPQVSFRKAAFALRGD